VILVNIKIRKDKPLVKCVVMEHTLSLENHHVICALLVISAQLLPQPHSNAKLVLTQLLVRLIVSCVIMDTFVNLKSKFQIQRTRCVQLVSIASMMKEMISDLNKSLALQGTINHFEVNQAKPLASSAQKVITVLKVQNNLLNVLRALTVQRAQVTTSNISVLKVIFLTHSMQELIRTNSASNALKEPIVQEEL
jgi:hypothetical protein